MFIHFYSVYVGHFLNTSVVFGPFWRPLWFSALDSRLVCLMVAPALIAVMAYIQFRYENKVTKKKLLIADMS